MPPARIGHRFQQLGQTMQSSFGKPALGLLLTESREDTLACDTIHERRLLERRVGLLSLSYLSWEASLSNHSQALQQKSVLFLIINIGHQLPCDVHAYQKGGSRWYKNAVVRC